MFGAEFKISPGSRNLVLSDYVTIAKVEVAWGGRLMFKINSKWRRPINDVSISGDHWSGQVRYGGIRRSSASPCDGTPSVSVWPSPRQTPGPPCPYPSDRTPPDATMKPVDALPAWSCHSDLDKNPMDGILRSKSRHMPIEA